GLVLLWVLVSSGRGIVKRGGLGCRVPASVRARVMASGEGHREPEAGGRWPASEGSIRETQTSCGSPECGERRGVRGTERRLVALAESRNADICRLARPEQGPFPALCRVVAIDLEPCEHCCGRSKVIGSLPLRPHGFTTRTM